MTLHISDTFTEASNTALESHTPETGGAWSKHVNFSAGATVNAANDRVVGDSTSTAIYYNATAPSSADYDVTGVLRASDLSTGLPGLLARIDTTASDFYQVIIEGTTTLRLQRVNAGVATNLASFSSTFAINTNYTVTLRVRGARIEVVLDGRWVINHLDASPLSAAGKAGLRVRSTSSVDTFKVTDCTIIQDRIAVTNACWTWFTDPRAIYSSGAYYIGSIQDGGSVKVDKYTVATAKFDTPFILADALEDDDHNNPAIIVLPNGKVACFYSKHNDTSGNRYRISTSAGNISAFDAEVTLGSGQTTPTSYSNPFYLSDADKVALFYRNGTPGSDAQIAYKTAAADLSSWDAEVQVCKGAADSDTPYFKYAQNGNGRIDVLCTDKHPVNGQSSVYHFYARWVSGAFKFYKSDGTEITATKPWRVNEQATLIYDGTSEKAWIWDIRIDADGRPRVLFTRYPSDTDHRYYFARWNGSAWTTPVEIAAGGTRLYVAETYYSGGMSFDGNDTDIIYLSIESGGVWELQEWRTDDNGATWAKHADITTSSGTTFKQARPYSPDDHDGTIAMLWWSAVYTSYTNFSTATIRAYENDTAPEVPPEVSTLVKAGRVGVSLGIGL